jgi:hypothetical protein
VGLSASRRVRHFRLLLPAVALAVPLALVSCSQPPADDDAVGPGSSIPTTLVQRPTLTAKPTRTGPLVPTAPVTGGGLSLGATLSHSSTQLVATYKETSSDDRVHLVIDRIPATLGSSRVDPDTIAADHAWVLMANGRVRVTKQAFPIAPDTRFIAEPAIGAHVLEPGASLTGTAVASLPPTLDVPGVEFTAPREPIDPNATEWEFCVQVAMVAQPRDVVPVNEVADGPLLCSPPARLPTG